ncbi:hypothetical protein BDZ89DRAFT_1077193 [Hymenopellis radicata]|nr:hypothetical protein BDZ89DRAFT_1077193 [Hymenopellis radicata]
MAEHQSSCARDTRPEALQDSPIALPTLSAPIEDLLSSNEPPSDADFPSLIEHRAVLSSHITRLDDELACIPASQDRRKTEQLEKDRTVLQERLCQFRGALSTMRRFPKEVLQEIFLKLTHDGEGFAVLDPCQGAWLVSRVCRSWRAASRCPRLWTTFEITSAHMRAGDPRPKNPVALLQTALRYSGSCSLDFRIEFTNRSCLVDRSRIQDVLDVLMVHSERWACASFTLSVDLGVHLLGVRGKVPELKRLTFVGEEVVDDDRSPAIIRAFEDAPKLTHATVETAHLELPYPQLRSFTWRSYADFPDPVDPLFVIRHCPNLVHLDSSVETTDFDVETRPVILRIANTSLMHLAIKDPGLLASVSLPALVFLEVADRGAVSSLPFLAPFIHASKCSITTLILRDSSLLGARLADILELVPCLKDLVLVIHSKATPVSRIDGVLLHLIEVLSEMADGRAQHRLVPNLESVGVFSRIVWEDQSWPCVGANLVGMLQSRRYEGNGAFRTACFLFGVRPSIGVVFPNFTGTVILALSKMRREGLDISLSGWDWLEGAVL